MGKGKCGYILTMPWGYFDKVSDFWEPDCWAAGLDQGCSPEPPDIKKKSSAEYTDTGCANAPETDRVGTESDSPTSTAGPQLNKRDSRV